MMFSPVELLSPRVLAIGTLVLVVAALATRKKKDERSPPVVSSALPYIGHLIQFMREGPEFWSNLRASVRLPIYTINFLSQEIYVINDPDLIAPVQRERSNKDLVARAITQRTDLVRVVFGNMYGQNKETIDVMSRNVDEKSSENCHRSDMHRLMAGGFGPTAPSTTRVYRDSMDVVARHIEAMASDGPICLDLLDWVRKTFTLGTAVALHGPGSPISKSPELIPLICTLPVMTAGHVPVLDANQTALSNEREFDAGRSMLALQLPSLLIPNLVKARETVVEEYRRFLADVAKNRDLEKAYPEITRDIIDLNTRYGFDEQANARSEFAMLSGVASNNVPAIFWMIAMVLRNHSLHTSIMGELREAIALEQGEDGAATPRLTLDIKVIKQKCPLLCATYFEVLRLKTSGSVALRVEKDFLLDDRYLLKKDALIMVPNTALHTDPESWGPDAHEFRPERFLDSKQHLSASFRPYGAGYNICPGRHLAKDQIIGMAALVLFSFDMTLGDPSCDNAYTFPKAIGCNVSTTMNPSGPLKVLFNPRKELRGAKWNVV